MDNEKVKTFMKLAGQQLGAEPSEELRKLGASLLLSEVLEYITDGLGLAPVIGGHRIDDPQHISFIALEQNVDRLEMIDGLADVAYTMYWNELAFGIPLEKAFDAVADNNLEKFVCASGPLAHTVENGVRLVDPAVWDCGRGVEWPSEVARVELVQVNGTWYAVGKDARGKVRKPSTYRSVDLTHLVA